MMIDKTTMTTSEDIKEALDSHRLWLDSYGRKGKRFSIKKLRQADLRGADLSKADLSYANMRGVSLSGACLYKADLSNADFGDSYSRRENIFKGDSLQYDFEPSQIDRCDLEEANLTNTNFSHCDMTQSYFLNAIFDKTNLTESDLSFSVLLGVDFTKSILRGSSLNGAHINQADFRGLDLNCVYFGSSNVNNAKIGSNTLSGGIKASKWMTYSNLCKYGCGWAIDEKSGKQYITLGVRTRELSDWEDGLNNKICAISGVDESNLSEMLSIYNFMKFKVMDSRGDVFNGIKMIDYELFNEGYYNNCGWFVDERGVEYIKIGKNIRNLHEWESGGYVFDQKASIIFKTMSIHLQNRRNK